MNKRNKWSFEDKLAILKEAEQVGATATIRKHGLNYATYPDFHGDYSVFALFTVKKENFDYILLSLKYKNNFSTISESIGFSKEIKEKTKNFNEKDFAQGFILKNKLDDLEFLIYFHKDSNHILFERRSW